MRVQAEELAEKAKFRRYSNRSATSNKTNSSETNTGDEDDFRGLEHLTKSGRIHNHTNVQYGMYTVMIAQKKQRRRKISSNERAEAIASEYRFFSKKCQKEAQHRGRLYAQIDEVPVQQEAAGTDCQQNKNFGRRTLSATPRLSTQEGNEPKQHEQKKVERRDSCKGF
eukprot:CAMPEP_0116842268 /NCGR_PEP_ID=MMETSP0418-20121206/11416_1 /TAXON_ID=1158023 /ORGANISM="Astrosyne radiata, Strain 13vi08-1A" /LENGTH=167 /DNA_ID=CAMNT_0004472847 /DNA_START=167 /DNA_END=670 /DNA_ORIENTATION=-